MTYGYDKPLHAPLKWKSMESKPRELDEDALDATIADILGEEGCAPVAEPPAPRTEFPVLDTEETPTEQPEPGLGAMLRQKWAQLSGAA